MDTSLFYWQEKLGKNTPRKLRFEYEITAAKTVSPLLAGVPVLSTFDALSTQAQIDSYLGTTNEFLLAQFDATSMGTDAFGGVVAMLGQVDKITMLKAEVYSTTGGVVEAVNAVKAVTTLTSSSLTTQVAVGTSGNIGFRIVSSGLDALTSGLIVLEFSWISK